MEIAVARRRQRLLRRARRQGQVLQPRPPARSARSARSRSTAATRTACSGITLDPDFATNQLAVPLLQRADARGAARLALHGGGRRHDRHGLEQVAAADPAPADHLLPLLRLADLRARRQPLHLDRRRHEHAESQGYKPIDDRLAQRAGRPTRTPTTRVDARRSSGNTNDLRGKILRITPQPTRRARRSTYTIPPGNLFGLAGKYRASTARRGPRSTRWATATRSGSRSTRRPAGSTTARSARTPATRTPTAARAATTSSTRSARRATWAGRTASPTTRPYSNWDFATQTPSGFFDCAAAAASTTAR